MTTETQDPQAVLAQWRDLLTGTTTVRIEFEHALSLGNHGMVHVARILVRRGQGWVKVGPVLHPPQADPTRAGLLSVLAALVAPPEPCAHPRLARIDTETVQGTRCPDCGWIGPLEAAPAPEPVEAAEAARYPDPTKALRRPACRDTERCTPADPCRACPFPAAIDEQITEHLVRIVNYLRTTNSEGSDLSTRRVDAYATMWGVERWLVLRIGHDAGLLAPEEEDRYQAWKRAQEQAASHG